MCKYYVNKTGNQWTSIRCNNEKYALLFQWQIYKMFTWLSMKRYLFSSIKLNLLVVYYLAQSKPQYHLLEIMTVDKTVGAL